MYYTDITQIIDSWIHNIITLLIWATFFSAVLSVCLFILIEHLFGPLEKISIVSRKIAAGDYEEKIDMKGEVEDNGKGMTKEQVAHVTDAFYRVDKSRSSL